MEWRRPVVYETFYWELVYFHFCYLDNLLLNDTNLRFYKVMVIKAHSTLSRLIFQLVIFMVSKGIGLPVQVLSVKFDWAGFCDRLQINCEIDENNNGIVRHKNCQYLTACVKKTQHLTARVAKAVQIVYSLCDKPYHFCFHLAHSSFEAYCKRSLKEILYRTCFCLKLVRF